VCVCVGREHWLHGKLFCFCLVTYNFVFVTVLASLSVAVLSALCFKGKVALLKLMFTPTRESLVFSVFSR